MNTVITKAAAQEEIDAWLDSKKVFQGKRESSKDHLEILIEAMSVGCLVLKEGKFVQTLLAPVGKDGEIKTLQYADRINRRMVAPHLQNVKASDGDGRILAYMAALTGQPKNILDKLDSEDQRIADSIVVFFVT